MDTNNNNVAANRSIRERLPTPSAANQFARANWKEHGRLAGSIVGPSLTAGVGCQALGWLTGAKAVSQFGGAVIGAGLLAGAGVLVTGAAVSGVGFAYAAAYKATDAALGALANRTQQPEPVAEYATVAE